MLVGWLEHLSLFGQNVQKWRREVRVKLSGSILVPDWPVNWRTVHCAFAALWLVNEVMPLRLLQALDLHQLFSSHDDLVCPLSWRRETSQTSIWRDLSAWNGTVAWNDWKRRPVVLLADIHVKNGRSRATSENGEPHVQSDKQILNTGPSTTL